MKNCAHRSRYKPGHGRKMRYKVYSWYHDTLARYSGAVYVGNTGRMAYSTPLLLSEPEVHARLRAWLRDHRTEEPRESS